jgi:predicted RNA-binding protein with PIN domain
MAELDWGELPEPVRSRLAEVASVAVGELPTADVPGPLRRLARFTPAKRARLGARQLVAELRDSAPFRTAVLAWWDTERPGELSGPDVDDISMTAGALLTGALDADERVAQIAERADLIAVRAEREAALARADKLGAELERLRAELAEARAAVRDAHQQRDAELDRLRKRVREQGMRVRDAEDAARDARAELAVAREGSAERIAAALVERDRARDRAEAERVRAARAADEANGAQQAARAARRTDEVRLALLMDTLGGALDGLRRELALESGPARMRPADLVSRVSGPATGQAWVKDGTELARLLTLPSAHLIVDGYNVSKAEYPELTLFDQRARLTGALGVLVARTGAEVTVVFDGAAVANPSLAHHPKRVRVLFSEPGVLADDVIRELVRMEPPGRPVVVASSDRAVAESVQRGGAHPMASSVLADLLRRV